MKQTQWHKMWRHVLRGGALAWLCLWSWSAHATHLVGGEIFYTHLSGNNYLITLKVYRDCGPANTLGTGFDDQSTLECGMVPGTSASTTLPFLCRSATFRVSPSCGQPAERHSRFGIEEAIYSTQVILPPNPYG